VSSFGSEPRTWTEVCLGEFGDLVRGVTYGEDDVRDSPAPGYLPVLRATNITDGALNFETELVYVKRERIAESQHLRAGDIVIAMSSGSKAIVGKAAQLHSDWEGAFGAFCAVFRTTSAQAIPSFISYLFQTEMYREHIGRSARGTNINNLTRTHILDFDFTLPTLDEQRAISGALNAVHRAKEARQRELSLEHERKATLMEQLFNHGTRAEPTKKTEIGEIPESWQIARLRDVVAVKGGKRLPKGARFAEGPTGLPYIRVVDFSDGSVTTDNLEYLSPEIQHSIRRYTIGRDDVYISIAGTIGLVGTIPEELDGANLTENAAKLVITDKASLDNHFLALILNSECGQRQIQNLTAKTTQPKLALMRIEQILIPKPSVDEQREIANVLRACEAKRVALAKEIMCLDELFRALLDELMAGRLSALPLIEEHQVR
jgi:type I restriction enzyme S subunit